MLKVFNDSNRKFQLEAPDGEKVVIFPGKFCNIDEKFQADITCRVAMSGGELKLYSDVKAAEKMIKDHEERQPEEPRVPATIEDAGKDQTNEKNHGAGKDHTNEKAQNARRGKGE